MTRRGMVSRIIHLIVAITVLIGGPSAALASAPPSSTSRIARAADSGAAVSLSPNPLDFGTQATGTANTQQIIVQNTGAVTLTITGMTIVSPTTTDNAPGDYAVAPGGGDGESSTPRCSVPMSLNPGDNCAINVRFTPSDTGTRTATLRVEDNASDSPQTVALTGVGRLPAPRVSYPGSLSFRAARIGQSDSQSIYVYNNGDAPLTFGDITVTASGGDNAAADFTLDTSRNGSCASSTSLTPYNDCYIYLTFTPSDAGARTAHLRIADNAGGSPHSVTLQGVGAATSVAITPAPLDFGRQQAGSAVTRTVTLTNTSGGDLTNFYASVYNNNYSYRNDLSVTHTSCPNGFNGRTLSAGASCTLDITFAPSFPTTETGGLSLAVIAHVGSGQDLAGRVGHE